MTSWSDFERYLKAEHLKGRRVTATIVKMTIEEVHAAAGLSNEPVLWFRETDKGLIVSPTNRHKLTELFGDDVAACIGKQVLLEAQEMIVAKRAVHPIRIVGSPDAPGASAKPAAAPRSKPAAAPPPAQSAPAATSAAPGSPPAAPESANADPAAAEFGALPSQGDALRERASGAGQPSLLPDQPPARKRKAAMPPTGEVARRWADETERLADEFPRFRLRSGDVDRLTMLYIVADLGHPKVDATNIDQVLAELRDHERARAAQE